jgi:magnesium transporter
VFFNLSAILGSAILYGDFKEATFHQLVTFLYGCAATFGGVYLIARSTGPQEEESDVSDPESATLPQTPDVRLETVRRRSRHLMMDTARSSPSLRRKLSTSSLVGFSPAQVGNPPLEHPLGADWPHDSACLLSTRPWMTMTFNRAPTLEDGR